MMFPPIHKRMFSISKVLCILPVFVLLTFSVHSVNSQRTVRILALYSDHDNPVIYSPFGHTMPVIGPIWMNSVTKPGNSLASLGITPVITYVDVQSNVTLVTEKTNEFIATTDVLLAPESTIAAYASIIALQNGVGSIVGMGSTSDMYLCQEPLLPPCTQPGSPRFPNQYITMTPGSFYFREYLAMAKNVGLNNVGVIWYEFSANIDVCTGAIQLAQEYKMNVTFSRSVPAVDYGDQDQNVFSQMIINELAPVAPEVLIVCDFTSCDTWIQALYDSKYTPQSLGAMECADYMSTYTPEIQALFEYTITPVQWVPGLMGQDYEDNIKSPYANQFQSGVVYNNEVLKGLAALNDTRPPSSLIANEYQAFEMIEAAIYLCNCTDKKGILDALHTVNMRTIGGLLIPNQQTGINDLKPMCLIQPVNGIVQIVQPVESATISQPVIPIPSWRERVYVSGFLVYSEYEDTIVLVFAIIPCLLAMIGIFTIIYNREHPAVKSSSWPFSIVTLIGYTIVCWAPLTWRIDNSAENCVARFPMLISGFLLTVTPILAKTFRIMKIFTSKKFQTNKMFTFHLAVFCLLTSLPNIVILVLWAKYDPLTYTMFKPDPIRPSKNYADCVSQTDDYLIATLVFIFLILVFGCCLAWYVWDIQQELFNESRPIMWFMVTLTLLIVFTVGMTASVDTSGTGPYLLRSLSIQISFTIAMGMFYLPKFHDVAYASMNSNGTLMHTDTSHKLQKLSADNKVINLESVDKGKHNGWISKPSK